MCQKNKDRFTNRIKSRSIYNTMERVFATISMALRGSTMSLSLSFRRTQSGANLETSRGGGEEVSGVTAAKSHPQRCAQACTHWGAALSLRGVAGMKKLPLMDAFILCLMTLLSASILCLRNVRR